ncbi:MAG: thioredoxin-disulfide reductase [Candidatus Kariarchaeaceae archaeon]
MVYEVIIIGSGPAGLTAGIYTARSNLSPLILGGFTWGGQLMNTTEVENYPGFPEGIMGPELMENMKKQAEKFGAEFQNKTVTKVDFSVRPFKIWTEYEDNPWEAKAVIIATGANPRLLGLESEKRLFSRGISTCATCDGFFFTGKKIAVIGGGDSACEEALFLTRYADEVHIVHRRDELRASKIMQERVLEDETITVRWNTVIEEFLGETTLERVKFKNTVTGEITEEVLEGAFISIGHIPNTDPFKGQIDLDEEGFIVIKDKSRTNVDGVFVAGDVEDTRYKQAITAAASGCKAALDVEKWLEGF